MSDYEYEEQNLDDFLIKSSQILTSEGNNEEKEIIIETLKQHLSEIFNNQSELQNFYKTLNIVIFKDNSNKIINKQCFKIFPIVFSFNPNSCFYYIDFFLFSINQSIKEENRKDFAFLCSIFSEIINLLFSEEMVNKNLLSKLYSLEENKKYKLYEKIFNFLKEKIKSTNKITQSFGCLLLTELIEKCPIIKEQKYLEEIFKLLSKYLEDLKFQCKLDILNCLISLIFITEQKFKPYANLCLFRVLDYLTDDQWIMRKLSINIVYTLVFFCREEIFPVKENIIEFLNILKGDPVEEIREVCLQTLKLLENEDHDTNYFKSNGKTISNNTKNYEKQIIEKIEKNINEGIYENKEINIKEQSFNNDVEKEKINKLINKKNHLNSTDKNNKKKINRINNKKENNNKNQSDKNISINKNQNFHHVINFNVNNKSKRSRTPKRNKIKQEDKNEILIRTQILRDRNQGEKSKLLNNLGNADTKNNSGNKKEESSQESKPKKQIIIQNQIKKENYNNDNKNIKQKLFDNVNIDKSNNNINSIEDNINEQKIKEEEKYQNNLSDIFKQLEKIQNGQNLFLNMINDLQTKLNYNYDSLNERISILEKNYSNVNNINNNIIKATYKNNCYRSNNKRKGKSPNYDELKNKFRLGKYNETLRDAIHNEKNLIKILPLIDRNNICKINNEIMEDIINVVNKKIILINLENGRTILSGILSFYMCVIKSKIPLKLISKLNIKDSLVVLKNKNNDRLLQIDINNIDAIVKSLKV